MKFIRCPKISVSLKNFRCEKIICDIDSEYLDKSVTQYVCKTNKCTCKNGDPNDEDCAEHLLEDCKEGTGCPQ